MGFPPHIIDGARDIHALAKEEVGTLKAKTDKAARLENVWAEYLKFIANGWFIHVAALVERESPTLNDMRMNNHPAIPRIEEAYSIAKEESDRIIRRYPNLLTEACRTAGLSLDSDSPHPRYTFDRKFFRLE